MRKRLIFLLLSVIFVVNFFYFVTKPVIVWGFSSNSSAKLTITDFSYRSGQNKPSMFALVRNERNHISKVEVNLILTDKIKHNSLKIPLDTVELPERALSELDLTWESPWEGWGLIDAELFLSDQAGETAQASTQFFYLPPEMATLSLASLLTLGGLAGRNVIARIVFG